MARPTGKVKTRKSTLGATKKERINSNRTMRSKSVAGSNIATLTSFSTKDTYNKSHDSNNSQAQKSSVSFYAGGGVGCVDVREECDVAAEGNVRRDAPPPTTPSIRRMTSFRGNNNHKQQVASIEHNKTKIKEGITTKEGKNGTKSHRVFSLSPLHRLMMIKKKSLPLTTTATTNGKKKKKSTKKSEEKHYAERVELVAMKNENDQPFTRILISKTLYKQRVKKRTRSSPSSSSPSNQEQTADEKSAAAAVTAVTAKNNKTMISVSKCKKNEPAILETIYTSQLCGNFDSIAFDEVVTEVAVPPPPAAAAAAVTAVTDVTAKKNKTMISVSKCNNNEPTILETIFTSQLCGDFDSNAVDEVVTEGCQASVEDSMGIHIIPTGSSPTMTCSSTATSRLKHLNTISEIGSSLGCFTNNNSECDDVPTTTSIPINDKKYVEVKELGETEMRQLITTNDDEAVAAEGIVERDAPPPPPPPPPPSIRRLMSFRGNNKNKQQVPTIDKINRRKERKKKLEKKNEKKNGSKKKKLHSKKEQKKNTAAATYINALENAASAAALATSVVPKEQEKNAAAVAAMDALEDAATAAALATCFVPVSTTNKCSNNDEDSSYSVSLCSSESESDVSDSRSGSDSDDSVLRSEDSYKNKGFLSKIMYPWSKSKSKGIPQSVSYVTDDDSTDYIDRKELEQYHEDLHQKYDDDNGDVIYGPKYSDTIIGTMPNIGIMSEFGSVFGFGTKKVIDVRDLRMVGSDSDISNSSSSLSSSSSDDSTLEEDNNYGDVDKYEYDDIAYSPCISHIVSPSFSEHNESGFSKERTFARKETKIESRYADVDLALAIDLDLARSLLVLKNHAAQLGVDPTELLNGIE
ncbi:hypothetical protein FRACYDRAFT_236370 [Fragilariopsis cylindrus CCMP1102]|uniref:Uncharacterized protein n=1 Tax=Fragilariopsis cylindrus CCMP1102 TaxID=635003 RepID=A0A1E7FQB7_9STRA|nr:hypothetical protein FRACYDRAFT_236370 [Fragilariopsis cylindrus CCMP1102]|eukprot:OEU20295.1 hypothetical protein FRACYDRAFT_236370 [Fragilariopsis cylindrus CCMP1102]